MLQREQLDTEPTAILPASGTRRRTNRAPAATVTVNLLGGFAAAVDGVAVPDDAWRLKKARELVKLLALAPGHRMHREQAMDVLWRDRSPAAAANNLHQAVYVARRALHSAAIGLREEMLELTAEVDVEKLELAAAQARRSRTPAAYRAALTIYSGELLPENRYDDWAAERRDELSDLAAELDNELAALRHDHTQRPSSVPAPTSSFVGRDRELGELTTLLHGTRLLTLVGTGGVGKTRLAIELANAAQPSHPDGTALAQLAPLADAALVADAVADALDVRALSGQSVIDAIVQSLAGRSLLLVLDNCEHLLATTAQLADMLLRCAPDLTILATSREPLRVAGEVVFRVPSLDIPDPEQRLGPSELSRYEAVRLFVERASAAAPGFALDDENALDIARICFRLDGLPLALELAASRLGALGPAAVAERLDDRFRVLRNGNHASPTRQQTLAATLQWSHDLLTPDEQALLRRLAVFAGGFDLEAVETVCRGGELDGLEIADVLARLVEKSLVVAGEYTSRERRYRLLETVRLYARHRLEEAGELAALTAAHARWALELAQAERGSPRLDRDAANLRAALDTLLERSPRDALTFCVATWPFWMRRIELHEAQRRFERALASSPERSVLRAEALLAAAAIEYRSGDLNRTVARASESYEVAAQLGDPRAEWQALQFLGECAMVREAADEAMPWLERALELAQQEGCGSGQAICIYSIGVAHWIRGELEEAEEHVTLSIELLRPLAGSDERVMSPLNLAHVRTRPHGRRPGLRLEFQDTLQPFVELDCEAAVSYMLASQAEIARARGDVVRARALLNESSARFDEAGDGPGKAAVLVQTAYLELDAGALGAARRALEQALELRRGHSDRRGLGLVLVGLGAIDTFAGDLCQAERHLGEAHEMFRRAGDRWGLAGTLWRIADLAFARGSIDDAQEALVEARAVLGATQSDRWIANTVAALAEIAMLRGEYDSASALLHEARERYAARNDAEGVAVVQDRLSELAKDALRTRKEALRTNLRTS